jgi:hypothetical protein
LIVITLTTSVPAPTPSTTNTPTVASSAVNNCYCQTIPLKDWGK